MWVYVCGPVQLCMHDMGHVMQPGSVHSISNAPLHNILMHQNFKVYCVHRVPGPLDKFCPS